MYAPEGYKAVCYRCSYESTSGCEVRCPVCRFPFILEAETTPPGGRQIEQILNRPTVSDRAAPPLPGVHSEKRPAQLLAESRKRRDTARRDGSEPSRPIVRPLAAEVGPARGGTSVAATSSLVGKLTFAILCVSAVAAGALAAVLQAG